MLVAFRAMTLEAVRRLHVLRDAAPAPARHLPRPLSPGAVMVRVRVARRRPYRATVHNVEPRPSVHAWAARWELKRTQGGKHV